MQFTSLCLIRPGAILLTLVTCLGLCEACQDQEQIPKSTRKLIEDAIEAHGGAKNLAKLRTGIVKYMLSMTGVPGVGVDVTVNVEEFYDLPSRLKKVFHGEKDGKTFSVSWALHDGKLWSVNEHGQLFRSTPRSTPEETLRPFMMIETLPYLLKSKSSFSDVEKRKFIGKDALSFERENDQNSEKIRYFFDPKSCQLLGHEGNNRRKPPDLVQNQLLKLKSVDGVLIPMEIVDWIAGKKVTHYQISEVRLLEKMDAKEFEAPAIKKK